MKTEQLLNAIGDIDDGLVLGAAEADAKPRKNRVKWGVLAACLCLLVAIPVAAAHTELLVELLSDESGWSVHSEHRFKLRDFSKEVRKLWKGVSAETLYFPMESLDDAEEFLGVEIPYNSSLERAVKDEMHLEVTVDGQKVRYDEHCLVMLHYGLEGKLIGADIWTQYRYSTSVVQIYYRMPTTNIPYEIGGGFTVIEESDVEQSYISPTGREFAIFYTDATLNDGYGYGVVDGVLMELRVSDRSQENLRKWMTKLLDGFE